MILAAVLAAAVVLGCIAALMALGIAEKHDQRVDPDKLPPDNPLRHRVD